MTSFGSMELQTIVMHQVLRAPEDSLQRFVAVLTDEPVAIQPADRAFLKKRFVKVLSGRGMPIVEEAAAPDTVRSAVRSVWGSSGDLVAATKEIVEHLASIQPGTALEGLLMIATATVPGDELILIAKVEHQEAMRIEPTVNEAGHKIFEIERLDDLVFGDLARIYKVAILSRSASSAGEIGGEIVDEQNGNRLANYFLNRFMGMRLREEPAVLTEQFLERMTSAINRSTMTAEDKLDSQSALVSMLRSNDTAIKPEEFIRSHIPLGHGPEVRALAEEASAPLVHFPKDTARLESRLARLRVDLDNGVVIVAPADAVGVGRDVQIRPSANGESAEVVARGRVREIRPTGSR